MLTVDTTVVQICTPTNLQRKQLQHQLQTRYLYKSACPLQHVIMKRSERATTFLKEIIRTTKATENIIIIRDWNTTENVYNMGLKYNRKYYNMGLEYNSMRRTWGSRNLKILRLVVFVNKKNIWKGTFITNFSAEEIIHRQTQLSWHVTTLITFWREFSVETEWRNTWVSIWYIHNLVSTILLLAREENCENTLKT